VSTAADKLSEAGIEPLEERVRAWEAEWLWDLATPSYPALRREPEPDSPLRTPFQRDRDRIVHAKAFRRLKHKTQVFVAPEGDHYRTRLTHTLEAVGISRTVARALRLNEDLTEAIGLGHDLGHPPFGHAGEAALDAALRGRFERGFRHNEHSLRVVDVLERDGRGLNLTHEVRDGILNHTGPVAPESLEGRIVKLVDRVAYINHDIDDALRAGVLDAGELPEGPVAMLGSTGSARIDAIVHDLVEISDAAGDIRQSAPVAEAMLALRSFLFERVYGQGPLRAEAERAGFVVRSLFTYFCERPDEMDDDEPPIDLAERVTDHVAGMTDRYALRRFEELLLPLAQAGP
jgi:dGTPase